jgi:hypothetical protein
MLGRFRPKREPFNSKISSSRWLTRYFACHVVHSQREAVPEWSRARQFATRASRRPDARSQPFCVQTITGLYHARGSTAVTSQSRPPGAILVRITRPCYPSERRAPNGRDAESDGGVPDPRWSYEAANQLLADSERLAAPEPKDSGHPGPRGRRFDLGLLACPGPGPKRRTNPPALLATCFRFAAPHLFGYRTTVHSLSAANNVQPRKPTTRTFDELHLQGLRIMQRAVAHRRRVNAATLAATPHQGELDRRCRVDVPAQVRE